MPSPGFYGTDTSGLPECVWHHLQESGRRYGLVILDHTYGIGSWPGPKDHMASGDVAAHAARFRTSGLLTDDATVYATHLSHEGCLEHNRLEQRARANGYGIAYDGLVVELEVE